MLVFVIALFYYYLKLSRLAGCSENVLARKPPSLNTMALDGSWFGFNVEKPYINFTSSIPFTVHNRLVNEGYLQDPYFRYNDRDQRWVALDTWSVVKEFNVDVSLLHQAKISLVFESIDTVSDVYFNKVRIGSSKSKFVRSTFDVTGLVVPGKNKVSVLFMSPIKYASLERFIYKKRYNYSVLPDCYPSVLHGECHSNFIRKEPLSFGWDFGPSFPTEGLLGAVYLQSMTAAFIENLLINMMKENDQWFLTVCALVSDHFGQSFVAMNFQIVELNHSTDTKRTLLPRGSSKVCTDFYGIPDKIVQKWWPWQYGKQKLYTLKAKLMAHNNQALHSKDAIFGFRTVQLIQEPIIGSEGLSFFFRVNDVDMFLKGSNWVPADAFRDRVSNHTIEACIQAAVDANMNVLRVWGGGGYETDYFYETCDRLGILLWQDFMFACAMYPTNEEFMRLVENEVQQQVIRLQMHPSIIVWSGNNENEVALREDWYGTSADFNLYRKDYIKLYVETIRPLVGKLDPTRPFVVSSPSNAFESEEEGWIAQDPRSSLYGDVHYYNYTANCWDTSVFPKPRFASEYGYQSFPSYEALRGISVEGDLTWNSTLMFYRQHHQDGNKQIANMIAQNFMLPLSTDKKLYFMKMIYLSQIVQAVCVTKETEHYRSLRGRLVETENSNYYVKRNKKIDLEVVRPSTLMGHTMGAMYWQLNDVWQAPSWSSIEYGGKWKMLHYHARDFFRDIIVTYDLIQTTLHLFVVSDILERVSATVRVTAFKWTSLEQLTHKEFNVTVEPQTSNPILTLEATNFCKQPRECFLMLCLQVEGLQKYSYSRPVFLTPLNQALGLSDPQIVTLHSDMQKLSPNVINFKTRVSKPAVFLWLSSEIEGRFSENGFLQYYDVKELNFTANAPMELNAFSSSLKAISYYDVTIE